MSPATAEQFNVAAPPLPPEGDAVLGYHQVLVQAAGGGLVVGNPVAVEVLAALP